MPVTRTLLLAICLLLFGCNGAEENPEWFTLSGQVVDKDGKGINQVLIKWGKDDKMLTDGPFTDQGGNYQVELPWDMKVQPEGKIYFSHTGHESVTLLVSGVPQTVTMKDSEGF